MNFLERYNSGEHESVWRELMSLGGDVRTTPHITAARAVADETMARVRTNLNTLRLRLESLGYRFGSYPDGTKLGYYCGPVEPPTTETFGQIDELASVAGPLPLSLEAFWLQVGAVDFTGQHDLWPESADPIVVLPPKVAIDEYAEWAEIVEIDGPDEAGPFLNVIAPDDLHKDNVSGGAPYGFFLPNGSCDAIVANEWHNVPFVEYLREAILGWGGFPGLSRSKDPPPREILNLRKNLIAF